MRQARIRLQAPLLPDARSPAYPRPAGVFECLTESGFLLLHLRRRTCDQALSLSTAQATHQYVLENGPSAGDRPRNLRIDADRFVSQVRRNAEMLSFEDTLMQHFSHRVVQYETHLRDPDTQQRTINAICADLAVAPATVRATLRRTRGKGRKFRVENEDELWAALKKAGLAETAARVS